MKIEKCIFAMTICLLFIATLNYPVIAKYIDDIISNFEDNNPEYLSVSVDNELKLLDDYKNENQIADIADKIEIAETRIISLEKQYEESDDILEMISIQMSIQEQKSNIYDLKHQSLNYTLQQNLDEAYAEISELMVVQQQNSLKYELYSSVNSAIVFEKKVEYYDALEEEKKNYIEIEKSKFKEGYSKQSDINSLNAELSVIKSEKFNIETQLDILKEKIRLNSGDEYYSHSIEIQYFSGHCLDEFIENDYNIPYLTLQIEAYNNHIGNLNSLLDELVMEGYEFESAKRIEDNLKNEIKYSEKYVEKLKLQLEQSKIELELYVTTLEKNYSVCEKQLESKEHEISSAKEQLKIIESMYREGYARPVDVLSKKTVILKLEAEKTEIEKQMSDYAYILSNNIINI